MRKSGFIAPILTGYAATAAMAVPCYLSLTLAIKRPNYIFHGVFLGGMFFLLFCVAVTALLVYRTWHWPIAAVMLPFVFGLILSSFIEMYFIQKETRA